ncbi:hypothetical protein EVAR_17151_1 [Eumeta japonica]|uniref:Uncharacterized protein n=1 Tax=Eumeta variegata TaxID=151549 RepID=A0A4C1UMA5_EUMVA|nr:hypothetical protein EVAR_17151_1 [Eumeta japonica]
MLSVEFRSRRCNEMHGSPHKGLGPKSRLDQGSLKAASDLHSKRDGGIRNRQPKCTSIHDHTNNPRAVDRLPLPLPGGRSQAFAFGIPAISGRLVATQRNWAGINIISGGRAATQLLIDRKWANATFFIGHLLS